MSMDEEFASSITVKFASGTKRYSTNQVFDRMWKQIGNAVDGRLAKAIGDTFLAAISEDLRRQPRPGAADHAGGGAAGGAMGGSGSGDGLGAEEPDL